MSEQSSTTTNTPAEPLLCKNGCGFFGNATTGNCCSKCWRELQKKKENNESSSSTSSTTAGPSPMEVDACAPVGTPQQPTEPVAPEPTPAAATASSTAATVEEAPKVIKKKKKKKTSYKAMMANMTQRNKDEKDIEMEKEGLRKVTGGGTFTKIDKI